MDPRLHCAAVEGGISLLRKVVAKLRIRAKPELLLLTKITTPKNNNVLHIAVKSSSHNNKEFVKHVIRQCPSILAQKNSKGETPLHIAAKAGHLEMLHFLVHCLCNVIVSAKGMTEELSKMKMLVDEYPSLYDPEKGGPLRAVPYILQASPLSLFSHSDGRTTLHQAIIANRDNEVYVWAKTFPDMIKKKDVQGWTPLHYASHFGFSHSVRILLAIDKSCAYKPDDSGTFAHLVAAHKGHDSVIREFYDHCPECFELLDSEGRTALHIATESRESEVVLFLIEKTSHHINLQDNRGYTPLLLASINQEECILASLRNHPKVHGIDGLGRQLQAFHVAKEMPIQLQFEANNKQHSCTKICHISRGAKKQTIGDHKLGPHIGVSSDTKKATQHVETHQSLEIVSIAEGKTPASQKVETHQSLEMVSIAEEEIPTSQEIKVPQDSKIGMQKFEASQTLQLPSKENEDGEARKDDISRRLKDKANIHLLVATLIATVSFAAGINLPGGNKGDGPYEGMANLTKKAAFQVFMVSNSLAFCFSAASIAIHFMIIIERRVINRAVLLMCALFLTFVGLIGMVTAFISGTIAVLAASVALWVASSIIVCCFFLVFYLIIGPPFRNRRVSLDVKKIQQAGNGQETDPSVSVRINEVHDREDESQFLYKLTGALLATSSVGSIEYV